MPVVKFLTAKTWDWGLMMVVIRQKSSAWWHPVVPQDGGSRIQWYIGNHLPYGVNQNTTIYGKEINSENERSCETQGRQMDNRMSVSLYKRTEPSNTVAAMEVFPKMTAEKGQGGTGKVHQADENWLGLKARWRAVYTFPSIKLVVLLHVMPFVAKGFNPVRKLHLLQIQKFY